MEENWKDQWERAAKAEEEEFLSFTEDRIVAILKQGHIGVYFGLPYIAAKKCRLEACAWPLFQIITTTNDFLVRTHATAGLMQLLGTYPPFMENIRLSGRGITQELKEALRTLLEERVGPAS